MRPTTERRTFPGLEVRDVNGTPRIVGHVAVYNSQSENLGGFVELIAPGAFRNVLGNDVRALFNHDANHVLGRTTAGTLALAEDQRGLVDEITPPDTPFARDLMVSIRRGDITGQSFSFVTERDKWENRGDTTYRTILEVRALYDVGPVTYPAYPATTVGARSLVEATGLQDAALTRPELLGALVRAERQLPAVDGDRPIIADALARLRALLPAESSQPEAQAQGVLTRELRERQLQLIRATL